MCQRATCKSCGKATYAGCGQHVEQVLAGIPQSDRCSCAPQDTRKSGGLVARLLGNRKS
ncbi:hypothetical protein [Actinospica robiniae]|uniref:hypothetical protein n=1 Tax=Actinospica robiniae TaxID=304901 RepID=UPI00040667E0|nr:hypothetical protein [Actinospica robiniae]